MDDDRTMPAFTDRGHPDFRALSEGDREDFLARYRAAVEYAHPRGLFNPHVGFRRLNNEVLPVILKMMAEEIMES